MSLQCPVATKSMNETTDEHRSCSPRKHEDAKNRKGFLRVFVVRFFFLSALLLCVHLCSSVASFCAVYSGGAESCLLHCRPGFCILHERFPHKTGAVVLCH